MSARQITALILAGRREGQVDPLAAAAGLADKCLIPIGGQPMILHVVDALAAVPQIGTILVSINDPATLDGLAPLRALQDSGKLVITTARANLVDSVVAAVEAAPFPVLVTTADNALLTPAAVAQFIAAAGQADVAVAFARRHSVLAAHPEGQRRFYKFRGGGYSNCNLFWLGSDKALKATESFRYGGQFAKRKKDAVRALGLTTLFLYLSGLMTIEGMFRHFSRRFGVRLKPLVMADGRLAIDVDNERTHRVAEEILARPGV